MLGLIAGVSPKVLKFGLSIVAAIAVVGALYLAGYKAGANSVQVKWGREKQERLDAAIQAQEKILALQEAVRESERRHSKDIQSINEAHHMELKHALNEKNRVIDGLRNGNIRLRQRFTQSASQSAVPEIGSGAGGNNGAGKCGLSEDDGEFLIRVAARCDAVATQLRAAQRIIQSDRDLINQGNE